MYQVQEKKSMELDPEKQLYIPSTSSNTILTRFSKLFTSRNRPKSMTPPPTPTAAFGLNHNHSHQQSFHSSSSIHQSYNNSNSISLNRNHSPSISSQLQQGLNNNNSSSNNIPYSKPLDERTFELFSYSILIQIFILYIIYLYFDTLQSYHPLSSVVLLGGHTSLLAQSLNQYHHKILNVNKNIKFYIWGVINGILTSYWIGFLVGSEDVSSAGAGAGAVGGNAGFIQELTSSGIGRFLVDQSFGACGFQFLFCVYNCVWERWLFASGGNSSNGGGDSGGSGGSDSPNGSWFSRVFAGFGGLYFKALKYSYLIWPFVSYVSFNVIEDQSILFPLNCFSNLVFTLLLSIIS
ncbi:unnamed protein product [Ambrosiozyma monospora]|uniref:Unnamed protein product n=1 Tax=Ambrosiozyma monospora TaxID=43982 RepID=A0A9W6YNY8_AMBMO|nr:unnamed protein product [Ambrosiozyma monospora]